jgi:hypothetical protein
MKFNYDIYALVYKLDALDKVILLDCSKLQLALLINQLHHEILAWVYVIYTFGRSIIFRTNL